MEGDGTKRTFSLARKKPNWDRDRTSSVFIFARYILTTRVCEHTSENRPENGIRTLRPPIRLSPGRRANTRIIPSKMHFDDFNLKSFYSRR